MGNVSIFLVDDNFVVRTGLRTVLDMEPGFQVVGDASTLAQAREQLRTLPPACVLLVDVNLPDGSGLSLIPNVLRAVPDASILMLTVSNDPALLARAVAAGAHGYLVYGKFTPAELCPAIRSVAAGGLAFDASVAPIFVDALKTAKQSSASDDPDSLTPREADVLAGIVAGQTNSQIAETLSLEEKTVKNYSSRIYAKLGVRNRYEAIVKMLQSRSP